ncbi:MAG: FG-GAP-like repeat-containing protein, partial [Methylophilaceae bacterium]|nr:FG-GAP-like repeat-containing protein [Methylophilaceae bacterium]
TPRLQLKIGSSVVQADWWDVTLWSSQQVSTPPIGNQTNVLLFTYVILPGQEDVNGISMPENALTIPVGMGIESGTVFSTSNLAIPPVTFSLAQPTALADNAKLVVKTNNISLQNIVAGTNGFVIHGLTDGLRDPYAYRPDLAREGATIAAAGDVNGDGYADFIFAEPEANDSAGASYVVFGGPNRSTALSANALGTAGFAINGENTTAMINGQTFVTYAYSGFSVANAGDINGDGLSDLIIGAPQNPALGATVEASGKAYVVFGKKNNSAVNLSAVELGSGGFVLYGALERNDNLGAVHYRNDTLGWSVATAGDVNGDGFADIVVSAPLAYGPPNPQGFVGSVRGVSYVVFGKADWSGVSALNVNDVLAGTGGFVIQQLIDGNNFFSGSSVSSLGDINGDGLADLVIALSDSGRLGYIVFGKKDTSAVNLTTGAAGIVSISGVYSDSFSVSAAGDVNGDGFADFIVGANTAGATNTAGAGLSYVVFGKSNWIDGSEINLNSVAAGTGGFMIRGEINGINGEFGDRSGYSVASAGDFNGDGLADLIMSSPSSLKGDTTRLSNRSYVVYGKSDTTVINLSDVALGRGGFSIEGGVQNGLSVSSAGDINGDGFSDLLITAPT